MLSESSSAKYRILIVDDHPLVRQGITMAMSDAGDMEPCGEAATAAEALDKIAALKPDAATVDLILDRSSGLDLIHEMRRRCPQMKILVVSMKDEGFYVERVIRAGAQGFLSKAQAPEQTVEALRRILDGGVYVSEGMASRLISRVAAGADERTRVDALTDRESAVLELIGAGLPARQIAKRLNISPKTVDSHREHIKAKLKLGNAMELTRFAVEWVSEQGTGQA